MVNKKTLLSLGATSISTSLPKIIKLKSTEEKDLECPCKDKESLEKIIRLTKNKQFGWLCSDCFFDIVASEMEVSGLVEWRKEKDVK